MAMELYLELPRDINKICRTCLHPVHCFDNWLVTDRRPTELATMVESITSLKVTVGDGLPEIICPNCSNRLNRAFEYKKLCEETELKLRFLVSKCSSIKPETIECAECDAKFESYYKFCLHKSEHNKSKSLLDLYMENRAVSLHSNDMSVDTFNPDDIKKETEVKTHENVENKDADNLNRVLSKNVITSQKSVKFNKKNVKKKNNVLKNEGTSIITDNSVSTPFNLKVCPLCDKEFDNNGSLSVHFLNHVMVMENLERNNIGEFYVFCETCGQLFDSNQDLLQHQNDAHLNIESISCPWCLSIHKSDIDYVKHFNRDHLVDVESTKKDALPCVLCSATFDSLKGLCTHTAVHAIKRYPCRHCQLSFCTPSARLAHLKTHPNVQNVCPICGDHLSSKNSLHAHMKGVHSRRSEYVCFICGKSFATSARLKVHVEIHTVDKRYVCSYCGYSTHKSGDLTLHVRTHTSERPYKCTVQDCTMSFKTSSHLCEHVRRHFNIKRFQCVICGLKFGTTNALKLHHMQHTGERPFSCSLCQRNFRRRYHLKHHMQQHSKKAVSIAKET